MMRLVVNKQETIVRAGKCSDVDRWILCVVFLQIQLQLRCYLRGINRCAHVFCTFGKQYQNRFVHMIINQYDSLQRRLY